jgi:pyridinium-3,5-biscarboxylic acid mononucleotide sulfurtransferase
VAETDGGKRVDRTVRDLTLMLSGVERLGVAFSGGVDSSVLLALSVRALGSDCVLAVLGVSPSLAARERDAAHAVARFLGVPLIEVRTHEGDQAAYQANGIDRCFHCKSELFTRIDDEVATAHGLTAVAYGENADDAVRPDRPGARAAVEHSVLRPLADLGLTKADVRDLARTMGLPCADKPAAPCLASRIPHFEPVTPEKLHQIDQAEAALADLGLSEFRVRHHGDTARVELASADLAAVTQEPLRHRVEAAVLGAGFRDVIIDPAGLQSGRFTLTVLQEQRG